MLTCARCFMLPEINDSCDMTANYHVDLEGQYPKSHIALIFTFYKCHQEGQNQIAPVIGNSETCIVCALFNDVTQQLKKYKHNLFGLCFKRQILVPFKN